MKTIDKIIEIVDNEELKDILNIGWIDRDEEIGRFVPLLNTLFFKFESKCLRVHRQQNTDFEICIKLVEESEIINEKYNNTVFEDYEFCISSLSNMFLYEMRENNYITKMEWYSDTEEKYQNGIVKCIGFEVSNNSYIFLDPISYNSFEIGKKEERNQWIGNHLNHKENRFIIYNSKELLFRKWRKREV